MRDLAAIALIVVLVGIFFGFVIQVLQRDYGQCLTSEMRPGTSKRSTYTRSVCTQWEYPDGDGPK